MKAMTTTRAGRTGTGGVVLVVAALLLSLPAAAASEKEREARSRFQAGEAHFKAGAFDEALAAYQAGYDAKPLPGFLVNIAQCQRRLGDLKGARATYQKFVLVAPDSPLLPQVRSMIAEIDALLEKNANEKPAAAAAAAADEETKSPEPAVAPVPAAAPREQPAAVLAAPAAEPRAETETPGRRWWLWGLLGAVVVGGAVTAIVLTTGGTTTINDGSLGTLRR
jgi:tetratricopeptide (TPR) repeat protein